MPSWGLTKKQRDDRPWDLDPAVLAPCKVTTDPIHGDIHTTVLEQAIVDTRPFQRLRRVRQLGMTHEVYPGATHSRFSHSLGALRVVQDLLDAVMTQHEGRRPVPDLIEQWRELDRRAARRDTAQAVVVARLGALLHDLCHVPFGHSIEDDLKVLVSHDENGDRFERLWGDLAEQLPGRVRRHLDRSADTDAACASLATLLEPDGALHRQLRPLIISKDATAKRLAAEGGLDYPFTADLVGNTICADLLDYLLRDHLFTGLPASLGHRFISGFFVVPMGRGPYSRRVALNIMQDGYERTDIISELLKALRYRYELSERALYHHAKLSADVMIGKALELWARSVWLEEAGPVIDRLDAAEALVERSDDRRLRDAAVAMLEQAQGPAATAPPVIAHGPVHAGGQAGGETTSAELAERVPAASMDSFMDLVASETEQPDARVTARQQRRLENEVLAHGDDGLLERLACLDGEDEAVGIAGPLIGDLRRRAARIGRALLERDLFVVGGHVGIDDAPAAKLYERFGSSEQRTLAQDEAQRFAEIGRDTQVLIWLPDPDMRLKLARVLVDNGEHINEFQAYEEARGRRGGDIYRAHRRLWSLWVFHDRALGPTSRDAVLVYLASKYGVAWERMRASYGSSPGDWVVRHVLGQLLSVPPLDAEIERLIPETEQVAARGPELRTISDMELALRELPAVSSAMSSMRRQ